MRRILVKYGGAALATAADRRRLMADLAQVVGTGAQLLVVHGGGPQATALARRLGHEPDFRSGRRVTDAAMLEIVAMSLIGQVGGELLAAALGAGLRAVATPAAAGRFVTAERRPPRQVAGEAEPVDFGLVADVAAVDPAFVEHLWAGGYTPLLSSPVVDEAGQLLNLNADSLVRGIVTAMPFDDVVYVADVPGVFGELGRPETHLASIRIHQIAALIADGVVQGGMIAKLDEIAVIVRGGASAAWIVGGADLTPVAAALGGGPGLRTRITS